MTLAEVVCAEGQQTLVYVYEQHCCQKRQVRAGTELKCFSNCQEKCQMFVDGFRPCVLNFV